MNGQITTDMITREEISNAINKGWCNYGEFTTDTAIDKVMELLEGKGLIHKSDVIDSVSKCYCFRPLGKTKDGIHCYDCNGKLR
jgi:hypothetical protein